MFKFLESQRLFNKSVDGTLLEFMKGWDYTLVGGCLYLTVGSLVGFAAYKVYKYKFG